MNMYKRPRHRRNRDTTPRTGTGPASGSHSAPDATSQAHIAHDQLSAIGQLRARQTDTPATARSIAWTPPRKHTRVLRILKDPECADRHQLCYARSGHVGRAARPSAIPERQPQAGRPVVAVPARSGHCRGASSARSPAVLALAAIAQRPRPPPPSSGENPVAGKRNDLKRPTRRLFAGGAHTGLNARGEGPCGVSGCAAHLCVGRRPGSRSAAEVGRIEVALAAPAPLSAPRLIRYLKAYKSRSVRDHGGIWAGRGSTWMGTKSPFADHLVLALVSGQEACPPASPSRLCTVRLQYIGPRPDSVGSSALRIGWCDGELLVRAVRW